MHLQPLTIERARLSAGSEAPAEPEDDPTEDLRDREEADAHRIKADVALGSTNTADIEWVERRLITLGFLTTRTEPTGVADAGLDAAIKAFQAEHPWPGKSANWDGVVEKGGKTDKFLRKTAFELAEKKQDAPASGSKHDPIDPAFVAAVAKLDRYGLAEVVSGLDVRISGGKPLWKSGRAASFNEAGGQELRQELHWEVFSEELLLPSWDVVDDKDDDLHADLPATILERIDLVPDKIVSESEIFMFYMTTEVKLQTSLEGKPEQRGDLTVWVRKATGGAAVGAQVTISGEKLDREFGTLVVGKKSLVVFEDIRGGEYRLHVVYPENLTHPNERVEADEVVNFEGTKKKVRIKVPRGWSDVVVHHDDGGAPVAGSVFDEHGKVVQTLTTGGSGQAAFRVRLGKYKVELGGRKKTLDVRLPSTDVTI